MSVRDVLARQGRALAGEDREPLYLMDGSAFIYRGFYANQTMRRSDGFPTGALFIVARILLRILREERPRHFVFVLDGHGPTFRHELFPLYKAQRAATPEDLVRQLDPIRRLTHALGLALEVSDGCEADDCIASLAKRWQGERPVILVATDKDLKQCLSPDVLMWDPAARDEKIVTLESFSAETGLTPAQWPDVQAVIGDASDNIPGVPGVGSKTAEKIFRDFPSLEAIRDRFAELPATARKKFDGHLEAVFLYRQLTTLATDRCAALTAEDMRVRPVDRREAAMLLREFELTSLERELAALIREGRVDASGGREPRQLSLLESPTAAPRRQCADCAALVAAIGNLDDQVVAVVPDHGELALAVCPADASGSLPPGNDPHASEGGGQECVYTGPLPALIEALQRAARVVTPDVKALLRAHPEWRRIAPDRWFDLGLASYLLDPEERDYAWPRLCAHWSAALDLPPGNPAPLALAIARNLHGRLAGARLLELMARLELPLIPVLADMEEAGVRLDAASLTDFLSEVQNDLDRLTTEVHQAAGGPFNIRSAQQLGDVLFHRLNLPAARKTRGGQASTSQDVLEKLSGSHPVVDALLAFRKLEKLRSTYLEPLPRLMGPDGRIRTTFNQLATATGRLSSSNPNLQNIPVRGALGRRMRACFTAPEGRSLISADYSQIELRVLAHLSHDETLLAAFRRGEDIHARTAGLLYDVDVKEVSADQRRNAKTINFGLIYGMGPQKLARELNIPLAEAKTFMQRYFERLQGIRQFYENVERQALEQGHVTTLAGRRRLLPDLHAENTQAQALARRQAFNTLIQGSAADIIKLAMLAVHADPLLRKLDARLILQVHDELLLEAPEAVAEQAGERVATLMAEVRPGGVALDVPLAADWGTAKDWGTAH